MDAPEVALFSSTFCGDVYAPAPGLNVGGATVIV
jgi:hypothetical protein